MQKQRNIIFYFAVIMISFPLHAQRNCKVVIFSPLEASNNCVHKKCTLKRTGGYDPSSVFINCFDNNDLLH